MMKKTVISLSDNVLLYETLDSQAFNSPMSLDTLAQIVDVRDQARVILFMRHGFNMPSNIKGVIRCGI
jgi:hypothetical protein